MLRALFAPLVTSKPASFDVPGSADEGARLLKNEVKSWLFPPLFHQAVVGRITSARVTLWRYRPFVQNSFIPIFSGKFLTLDGKTVLAGRFGMHWFARLFMLIWLSAFLLIWAVLAVQSAISTNSLSDKLMSFILPLLMFAFGLGLIHLGRWFSRGDIAFLEQAIKHALHHGDT